MKFRRRLKVRVLDGVRVGPDEVLVIHGPPSMTYAQAQEIEGAFSAEGVRVVILGGALTTLSVSKRADAAESAREAGCTCTIPGLPHVSRCALQAANPAEVVTDGPA